MLLPCTPLPSVATSEVPPCRMPLAAAANLWIGLDASGRPSSTGASTTVYLGSFEGPDEKEAAAQIGAVWRELWTGARGRTPVEEQRQRAILARWVRQGPCTR